ncbi:MAG: DNA polymerase III subunit beta [Phycisphaerales bacterium]
MKVICDRGVLLDAVNLVAAVVPTRTPTPALSCVKLVAKKHAGGGGELVLAGTDAETSLSITVTHVDVQTPGQCAIPGDKLRAIVSAEDGEPTLTIETDGDQVHIKGANAHFRVFGYPPGDFPALPDLQATLAGEGGMGTGAKSVFTQHAGALLDLVTRTVFATARETSRYAINGVLLKRDGKKLEMVATDGRRLAVSRTQVLGAGGKEKESVSCIIPTKALGVFQKLARDPEENVRLVITDTRVFFAFEPREGGRGKKEDAAPAARAVLSSTLVEGSFPPYEDVIPKEQDKKIVANRDDLGSAVRKASVLTNEESRGVRMAFSSASKKLKLSSRAPEMGDSEIDVDLSSFEGDDIEISFNPSFITDVLRVVTEPEVIIELKAQNKPGLIRSSTNDFLYVVMPVNLPG